MSDRFPLMLYRDGDAMTWEGRGVDCLIVHDLGEEQTAKAGGWMMAADLWATPLADKALAANPVAGALDRNAPEIIAGLAHLTADELEQMLVAERAGKARKGVVSAIEAALKS